MTNVNTENIQDVDSQTCCICLEKMNDLNDTILLSCNHVLHKQCLFSYISTNYKNVLSLK